MTSTTNNSDQTVYGTGRNDSIRTGAGNDRIFGSGGNDYIDAGAGNDYIDAGDGNDTVLAGTGNDTVYAGAGNDTVYAGDGNDFVDGGDGNDSIDGGDGNDTLLGGAGNDCIQGGDGDDSIDGGIGDDRLSGGEGNDVILGGAGNDDIDGDCGNDTLDGGAGINKVDGDSGNDTLVFNMSDHAGEGVGSRYAYSDYDGGCDIDTLKLVLTRDQWLRSDVQNDVARFLCFLQQVTGRNGEANCSDFYFSAFNLKVEQIEKLVIVVDGLVLDPRDEGVTARADSITATEDAPSLAFNLLANDSVPDLVKSVTITNPAHGTVVLTQNYADPANPVANVVYTPNATYYQYLAAGEKATDTFTYTVTDADGDVSTQTVTVTILGQNDGPTIVSGQFSGAVVEDAAATLSTGGAITFVDLDLTDSHTVAVGAARVAVTGNPPAGFAGANGFGTLTATVVENTTDQNNQGVINWSFAANNAAVQRLAAGQVATQTYTLTLTDKNGAIVTQDVTVTLTGTNDGPTIGAATASGATVEDGTTAVAGNIAFADVDLIDTHSVSFAAQGTGYRGTFTSTIDDAATGDGTGNVKWTFNVDNAAIQDLAQGEVLTQKYTVTVKDNNGATTTQVVTVTITGTNDAPVITSGAAAAAGAVSEAGLVAGGNTPFAGNPNAAGQLTSSDVDHGATATWSGTANGSYGNFAIDPATGKWTYVLDNARASTQALTAGETVTDKFLATVTDDKGATATQWVTVTVTGSNDGPVITSSAAAAAGAVSEAGLVSGGNTAFAGNPNAAGQLTSTDVDRGATATWSGSTNGTYGSFAIDPATGKWTYVLDNARTSTQALAAGETVTDKFLATVTDDKGATATTWVTVTVTGSNDGPVITSDAAAATGAVREAGVLAGGNTADAGIVCAKGQLSSSDVDHGATATWSGNANDSYGSFVITADGKWTYTLDNARASTQALAAGETVTETFLTTVTDDKGATATQLVTVTVAGTNDAPVITSTAAAAVGTVREAGVVDGGNAADAGIVCAKGQLASSDVDHGATATWSGSANGGYGSFAIDAATGKWVYTLENARASTQALAAGETVTETFLATVTDDKGATATQLVSVTVVGTNDAPVITSTNAAAMGAVREAGVLDGGNTADAGVACAKGQLTSSDVDHNATATWSGNANGGYGSFAIDPATGKWVYTLDNARAATQALAYGETVTETFLVTVTDDRGATATQLVSVTVAGTNDAPVITSSAAAATGAVVEAGLIDGGNTATAGTPSAAGQLTSSDVDHNATATWSGSANGTYGSFVIDPATGKWVYTLDNARASTQALAAGETVTETFVTKVTDDHGAIATQVVTVTVTGSNDGPVVTSNAAAATGAVTEAGIAGAGIPSAAGQLTSSDVDHNATATWSGSANGIYGSFAINPATGAWTYLLDNGRPATDALKAGEVVTETFLATVTDDRGATATQLVTVTITGTNDAPVAVADSASTVEDQFPISGSVATNDSDVDHGAVLTYALNTPVAGLTFAANGSYSFDPANAAYQALARGEVQTIVTSYTVTDDQGATATATLTITVTGTNDAPTAMVDVTSAVEDGAVVMGSVATNDGDVDYGAVLSWALLSPVAGLTLNGNGSYSFNPGDAAYQALAQGEVQTIVASYGVTDEYGVTAYSALIIVIAGTNDAPVVTSTASAAAGTVVEAGLIAGGNVPTAGTPSAAGQLTSSDVDHNATATWSGSANGTYGSFAIGTNGAWTYTLGNGRAATDALAAGETRTETFLTTVTDDKGATATQLVTVTVVGTNDGPVVTSSAAAATGAVVEAGVVDGGNTAAAGTPSAAGQLTSSDVDHNATATWTGSANGTYGSFAIGANGAWSYVLDNARSATDALAAGETVTETFLTTVTDDQGATATQLVTVTVTGTNDAPVVTSNAAAASGMVKEAGVANGGNTPDAGTPSAAGQLTSSDVDHNATASWSGSANGTYGSFAIGANGAWTYALDNARTGTNALAAGETVTETFTATVTDDHGATATQVVTVTVTGTNDAPVVRTTTVLDTTGTVIEAGVDEGGNTPLLGNPVTQGQMIATDADHGAVLTWSGSAAGQYGTFQIAADGSWTYVLDNARADALAIGENVREYFTTTVTDEHGATATQVIAIRIFGNNDAPVAIADTGLVAEDSVIAGSVAGNDSDVDHGAVLSFSLDAPIAGLTFNADGSYTFDAGNAAYQDIGQGEQRVVVASYTVTDEHGASAQAPLTIFITGTNDAPVAVADTGAVLEDRTLGGTVAANDSDIDHGAVLTYTLDAPVAGLTLLSSGAYLFDASDSTYQHLAQGATQVVTAHYTVTDEHGATATSTLTITVTGTNDRPVAQADSSNGGVATGTGNASPIGSDFLISSVGYDDNQQPTVTKLAGGGFVVAWYNYNYNNGAQTVHTQRFDAAGAKVGAESTVSFPGNTGSYEPSVAALPDGGYVVAFGHYNNNGSLVNTARYDSAGQPVGSPQEITFPGNYSYSGQPSITALAGGGYAVAMYADGDASDGSGSGLYVQLIDSHNQPVGTPILANTTTLYGQYEPNIAALSDGGFVVTWRDESGYALGNNTNLDIRSQRFDASGSKVGSEQVVNTTTVYDQFQPTVAALAGGGYVVVWSDNSNYASGNYADGNDIRGQIFDAAGNKVGGEFVASMPAIDYQTDPSVIGLPGGGFIVAWSDNSNYASGNYTDGTDVRAQVFDATGGPVGSSFVLSSHPQDYQYTAALAALDNGAFVASWIGYGAYLCDDSGSSIIGRLFSIAAAGNENSPVTIDVLANDTDVDDGAVLTLTNVSVAAGHGHASIVNNQLYFDPGTDFDHLAAGVQQTVTVVYTIRDEYGATSTSVATITITGNNDAPVALADTGAVMEDHVLSGSVATNDSDVDDGAVLTYRLNAPVAGLTLNADGSYSFDAGDPAYQSLAQGEVRTITANYTATDDKGANAASTLTLTVTGTNDAPVIGNADVAGVVNATATATPTTPILFTVQQYVGYSSNDFYAMRDYAASHAADYTVQTNVVDFTDDPGGFAGEIAGSSPWPAAVATGETGQGGVNDGFFARITTSFDVTTADTFTFRTFNDDGVYLLIDGQFVIADSGYHPEYPFEGSIYLTPGTHTIELFYFEGGGEASLELTVRNSSGAYGLLGGGGGGIGPQPDPHGTVNFTDVDASDRPAASFTAGQVSATGPSGAFTLTPAQLAEITSGFAISTPSANTNGGKVNWTYHIDNSALSYLGAGDTVNATFRITVTDGHGASDSRDVTITINGANDAPTAVADSAAAFEDGALLTGTVAANDSDIDHGAVLHYTLNAPVAGLTLNTDGSYSFDPSAPAYQYLTKDQLLVVTAAYTVTDEFGATATSTLTLNVTGTNDAPSGADKTVTLLEDGSYALAVADFGFSDVEGDGFAAVRIGALPGAGTLRLNGAAVTAGQVVTTADIAAGKLVFAPAANGNGNGYANFTFQVQDNGGTANGGVDIDQSANRITFNVTPVNDSPSGTDGSVTLLEDTSYAVKVADFGFSDGDGNALQGVKITTPPGAGTFTLSGVAVTAGQLVSVADIAAGKLVFTPALNANGTSYASYTFQVRDDGGTANGGVDTDPTPNKLTFNVTPVNDAPVAVADTRAATEDTTVSGSVATNDSDPDGDTLTYTLNGTVPGLTLASNGGYTFNAGNAAYQYLAAGQTANVVANYTVSDGNGGTATSTLTITVTGTNDAPVATALSTTATEGGAIVSGSLGATDADQGAVLTYAATNSIAGLTIGSNGTYSFDPTNAAYNSLRAGATQTVVGTYKVTDDKGASTTSQVSVVVTGTNDAPSVSGTVALAGNTTLVANRLTNGDFSATPDLAGWTINTASTGTSAVTRSTVTVNRSGSPITGDSAVAQFTYDATVPTGYGTGYGPSITSQAFTAVAGDTIRFVYVLSSGTDQAIGTGYIRDAATGAIVQTIFNYQVPVIGSTGITTVELTMANSGNYTIDFRVGSYDATGGRAIGATLYVGTAQIIQTGISEDGSASYSNGRNLLLAKTTDPDTGDVLTVPAFSTTSAHGATVTLDASGTLVIAPGGNAAAQDLGAGQTAIDTFTYQVSDGMGGFATATGSYTLVGQNDAPTVVGSLGSQYVAAGSSQTLATAAVFKDVDANDTLTYTAKLSDGSALPSYLSINGTTGVITSTATSANIGANLSVVVTAKDTGNLTASHTFALVVDGPTLTGTAAAETINGTNNGETILGLGGDDTLNGGAGNDHIDGGAGHDELSGGAGNDIFVFHAGEADGDSILDFSGNGTGAGDSLSFYGFGTAAQGASFVQIDATHWQVNSANGALHEVITVAAGTTFDATDITFFPGG